MQDFYAALRDRLAELYTTEQDARRLARDAGLKTQLIDFDGSGQNAIQAVVRAARQEQQLVELIEAALHDYEGDMTLIGLRMALRYMSPVQREPIFRDEYPVQYAQYRDLDSEQKINQLYELAREHSRRGTVQNMWLIFHRSAVDQRDFANGELLHARFLLLAPALNGAVRLLPIDVGHALSFSRTSGGTSESGTSSHSKAVSASNRSPPIEKCL